MIAEPKFKQTQPILTLIRVSTSCRMSPENCKISWKDGEPQDVKVFKYAALPLAYAFC